MFPIYFYSSLLQNMILDVCMYDGSGDGNDGDDDEDSQANKSAGKPTILARPIQMESDLRTWNKSYCQQ